MVTVDSKSASGHSNPLASPINSDDELQPPSYDLATSYRPAGSSSHTQQVTSSSSYSAGPVAVPAGGSSGSIPPHLAHLFAGPPNCEPLLGRGSEALSRVEGIEVHRSGSDIITTDARLKDPAVLYDFLRKEALTPPIFKIHMIGAHYETAQRTETVTVDGVPKQRTQGQTDRIVDFDFTIDLTPIITHEDTLNNIHLHTSLPDAAVNRGTHNLTYSALYALPTATSPLQDLLPIRECLPSSTAYQSLSDVEDVKLTDPGRIASWSETRLQDAYTKWRSEKGIPAWIDIHSDLVKDFWEGRRSSRPQAEGQGALRLSERREEEEEVGLLDVERSADMGLRERLEDAKTRASLKEWCEAYCASPALLKEFHMVKGVWGWDQAGLQAAVRGAILSTGYESNECTVEFASQQYRVIVKSDSWLSKALNRPFVVFLLWITLIYPIIWVWQRLHPMGGARWNIARASYSTKFYPTLPETYPTESIASATTRLPTLYKLHPQLPPTPILQKGPKGVHYLVGKKEGEWFREWEDRIRMGVRLRFKGELEGGYQRGEDPNLDGY